MYVSGSMCSNGHQNSRSVSSNGCKKKRSTGSLKPFNSYTASRPHTVGAFIIRIGFGGPLYHNYNMEPPTRGRV